MVNSRKQKNAATVVLAVVPSQQIPKLTYTPGVVYAEERDRVWAQLFGVSSSEEPLTLIVNPEGRVLWEAAGDVNEAALAAALEKHLVVCGLGWSGMIRSNVRIGQPAPNFLFSYADGKNLTLRKLIGRRVAIVFSSGSPASLDAVRTAQQPAARSNSDPPLVLVISDQDAKSAAASASAGKLVPIIVPDPKREIASAYGVQVWPTTVSVDGSGLIAAIQLGTHAMATTEAADASFGRGA